MRPTTYGGRHRLATGNHAGRKSQNWRDGLPSQVALRLSARCLYILIKSRPGALTFITVWESAMKTTGSAVWSGGIKDGRGAITTKSGALKDYPYGFASRFEGKPGTNPEELIG